jgi:hypothetical protein
LFLTVISAYGAAACCKPPLGERDNSSRVFAEPPALLGGVPRWQVQDQIWVTSLNGPVQWQITDAD